jgi:hypothetical protein
MRTSSRIQNPYNISISLNSTIKSGELPSRKIEINKCNKWGKLPSEVNKLIMQQLRSHFMVELIEKHDYNENIAFKKSRTLIAEGIARANRHFQKDYRTSPTAINLYNEPRIRKLHIDLGKIGGLNLFSDIGMASLSAQNSNAKPGSLPLPIKVVRIQSIKKKVIEDLIKYCSKFHNLNAFSLSAADNWCSVPCKTDLDRDFFVPNSKGMCHGVLGAFYFYYGALACPCFDDTLLFKFFSSIPSLKFIGLENYSFLGDKTLVQISLLHPNLVGLTLNGSSINGVGIQSLASLSSLSELNLKFCYNLDEAAVGSLSKLTNLKILDLSLVYGVTDKSLDHLTVLTNLQVLHINSISSSSENFVTDAGIVSVSQLNQLRELSLSLRTNITDDGFATLSTLKNLETLDITDCTKLTLNIIPTLKLMPNLQRLVQNPNARVISKETEVSLQEHLVHLRSL